MQKKSKMGQPAISKKAGLGKTFGARLRPDEESEVLQAIKSSGQSQTEWVRQALLDAAKKQEILDSLRSPMNKSDSVIPLRREEA